MPSIAEDRPSLPRGLTHVPYSAGLTKWQTGASWAREMQTLSYLAAYGARATERCLLTATPPYELTLRRRPHGQRRPTDFMLSRTGK